MKIHDVKQGTGEWKALRLGIPTASEFDAIVTPLFKAKEGAGPETYVHKKICERLLGYAVGEDFSAFAVEQGVILESEAIPWYDLEYNAQMSRPGFCTTDDGRVGCSPDALIGEDGGLEIKCPQPHTHLKYFLNGTLPPEYAAQVHGSMYVTGRKWWDFLSYSRQFPALVVRVRRDEAIQAKIHSALTGWLAEFDAVLARIQGLKDAENALKNAAYQEQVAKSLAEGKTP